MTVEVDDSVVEVKPISDKLTTYAGTHIVVVGPLRSREMNYRDALELQRKVMVFLEEKLSNE